MENPYADVFATEYITANLPMVDGVKCVRVRLLHAKCFILIEYESVQMLQNWMFQDYRAELMRFNPHGFYNFEKSIPKIRLMPPMLLKLWRRDGKMAKVAQILLSVLDILNKCVPDVDIIAHIRQRYHRRLVLHWCWCANQLGVCRDIRRKIGEITMALLIKDMLTVQPIKERKKPSKYIRARVDDIDDNMFHE
jgi:hypothetical protein